MGGPPSPKPRAGAAATPSRLRFLPGAIAQTAGKVSVNAGFAANGCGYALPLFAVRRRAHAIRECHPDRCLDHTNRETELPTSAAPTKTGRSRRAKAKPSCESCYFGVRMLCALELGEPCTTFRPDSPQGLTPPAQPMLLIGAEGATLDTEPQPLAA